MLQVSYRDSRPIYEQIHDAYRQQILSGALPVGSKLPSVRELSAQLAVNPNTIQRAYRELEREGCTYSVQGKGSFVADVSDLAAARREELLDKLDQIVSELESMGITRADLLRRMEGSDEREHHD